MLLPKTTKLRPHKCPADKDPNDAQLQTMKAIAFGIESYIKDKDYANAEKVTFDIAVGFFSGLMTTCNNVEIIRHDGTNKPYSPKELHAVGVGIAERFSKDLVSSFKNKTWHNDNKRFEFILMTTNEKLSLQMVRSICDPLNKNPDAE